MLLRKNSQTEVKRARQEAINEGDIRAQPWLKIKYLAIT